MMSASPPTRTASAGWTIASVTPLRPVHDMLLATDRSSPMTARRSSSPTRIIATATSGSHRSRVVVRAAKLASAVVLGGHGASQRHARGAWLVQTGFVHDDRDYHCHRHEAGRRSWTTPRWLHRAGAESRSLSAAVPLRERGDLRTRLSVPRRSGRYDRAGPAAHARRQSHRRLCIELVARHRPPDRRTRWPLDERRPMALTPTSSSRPGSTCIRRQRDDATACELGRIPAGAEHQRAAGGGDGVAEFGPTARGRDRARPRAGPSRRSSALRVEASARITASCARATRTRSTRCPCCRSCAGIGAIAPESARARGVELLLTRKSVSPLERLARTTR